MRRSADDGCAGRGLAFHVPANIRACQPLWEGLGSILHFKASKLAILAATVWAAWPQTMRSAVLAAAVATATLASPATARTKEYVFTYSGLDLNLGDTCDTCRITATITLAGPLSQYLDTSDK
jgi:hypothetical protein